MKKILFVVACLALLNACKNQDKTEVVKSKITTTNMAMSENYEEEEEEYIDIEELPNDSDYYFADAFDAFEDGDYEGAIAYINIAIENLREEAADLDAPGIAKVEASIKKLQALNKEIKAAEVAEEGTVENSDDLADKLAVAFANAEMTVAHDYLLISQIYVLEEPRKAKSYLSSAITKMENATSILTGTAKAEAIKILAESKALIDKEEAFIQKEGAQIGKAIDTQLDKMGAWLRKHAKEMK